MKAIRGLIFVALVQLCLPAASQTQNIVSRADTAVEEARQLLTACAYTDVLARSTETLGLVQAAHSIESIEYAFVANDFAGAALQAGDLDRAEGFARRASSIARAFLPDSALDRALIDARLGMILIERGKLGEAIDIEQWIRPTIETGLQSGGARAAEGLQFLWRLALVRRQLDKAAGIARDYRAFAHRIKSTATEAGAYLDLASTLIVRGDLSEAENAIGLARDLESVADPSAARIMVSADLAAARSDFSAALDLLAQAEPIVAKAGPCAIDQPGNIWKRRGDVHMLRRTPAEAVDAYSRALASYTAAGLDNGGRLARVRYGLALSYALAGQFGRADPLFAATLEDYKAVWGAGSAQLAQVYAQQALVFNLAPGRNAESERLARLSLDQLSAHTEPLRYERANATSALAFALMSQDRLDEAKDRFEEALALFQRVSGPTSSDLVPGLIAVGEIALKQGQPVVAQRPLQRALDIQIIAGWSGALGVSRTKSLLAQALAAQGQLAEARNLSESALTGLAERLSLGSTDITATGQAELDQARRIGEYDITLMFEQMGQPASIDEPAAADRFLRAAQLATRTRTGASIAQTSARLAERGGPVGVIIGERQQQVERVQALEEVLARGIGDRTQSMATDVRRALLAELLDAKSAVTAADTELMRVQPRLARLMADAPATLKDVASALGPGEAIVQLLLTGEASYALVATSNRTKIVRSPITGVMIEQAIADLRMSLDPDLRTNPQLQAFNADAAYVLYRELIAPAEDVLESINTIHFVPDGGFQNLPLGVLLTAPPTSAQSYSDWPWLIRRHAIALQSSVSSWLALRQIDATAPANLPFLGVGDPVLGGAPQQRRAINADDAVLGGRASPETIRKLGRLQETHNEIVELSRIFEGRQSDIFLGERAREGLVKSASITLRNYNIIAFATHGLAPGDLGLGEPGLVLTPPDGAGDALDDGLLTASEIATLDLNAEWVILSACRTASDDGRGRAEGLSGLARSFFVAGARSVLVSHWPIESRSASAFTQAMAENVKKGASKSAALQGAQQAMINNPAFAHPFFWAPYSVVAAK